MLGIGKMLRFAFLSHDVANINHFRLRLADRLADFLNHQIRQNAGKQAAGAKYNHVGIFNGRNDFSCRHRLLIVACIGDMDTVDRFAVFGNMRFAGYGCTVRVRRMQGQRTLGSRINMAVHVHNLTQQLDGFVSAVAHFRQGRNNQITDCMIGEKIITFMKPVLKQIFIQFGHVRQGNQHIAQISRRGDVDTLP